MALCSASARAAWRDQEVSNIGTREAAILAGGHCIPVQLPAPERFIWHKLYSSIVRKSFPEKALKDRHQATVLAAVLTDQDEDALADSAADLPSSMRKVLSSSRSRLLKSLDEHPPTQQALHRALSGP